MNALPRRTSRRSTAPTTPTVPQHQESQVHLATLQHQHQSSPGQVLSSPPLHQRQAQIRLNASIHGRHITEENRANRPAPTGRAYDAKAAEFVQYCEAIHPEPRNSGLSPSTVTSEKVYDFFAYIYRRPTRQG